jgi:trehalose-6-phosphatase
MRERVLTDGEIYEAFSRLVAKQDNWRGYFGDDVTDDEVLDWLDRADQALQLPVGARGHRDGAGATNQSSA